MFVPLIPLEFRQRAAELYGSKIGIVELSGVLRELIFMDG